MEIRYDFDENLDLSNFQKQAPYYIGKFRQITYNFFLKDFKIIVDIATPDNNNAHIVRIYLYDFVISNDQIVFANIISPSIDDRFKEIGIIKLLFEKQYPIPVEPYAEFFSNSTETTTNNLISLIKVVHRINYLKCFL